MEAQGCGGYDQHNADHEACLTRAEPGCIDHLDPSEPRRKPSAEEAHRDVERPVHTDDHAAEGHEHRKHQRRGADREIPIREAHEAGEDAYRQRVTRGKAAAMKLRAQHRDRRAPRTTVGRANGYKAFSPCVKSAPGSAANTAAQTA